MMGNEEIKKANRKALPKFILLCIVGALIGGVAGYLVGANGIDTMSGDFKVVVSNYVELTAPWIMLAIAVIIPIVLVPYYRKAKKQLSQWDGEDEEVSDGVEEAFYNSMGFKWSTYNFIFSYCGIIFRWYSNV